MSRPPAFPTRVLSGKKHSAKKCLTCKNKKRKEIEALYMEGKSPEAIVALLGIKLGVHSIRGHVKAFGADIGRLYSALASCDLIITRFTQNFENKPKLIPTGAVYMKAIELKAKITGELVDMHKHKHEFGDLTVNVKVDRQVDNLKARLAGVPKASDIPVQKKSLAKRAKKEKKK